MILRTLFGTVFVRSVLRRHLDSEGEEEQEGCGKTNLSAGSDPDG